VRLIRPVAAQPDRDQIVTQLKRSGLPIDAKAV
jgi:hypothetical protein